MLSHPRPFRPRTARMILSLALILTIGTTALGQMTMHSVGPTENTYTPEDLKRFDERVGLDESQSEILNVLFEDYQAQYRTISDDSRRELMALYKEASENQDWETMHPRIQERQKNIRAAKKQLNTQFINDLRSLLTDEQQTRWPLWDQDRYRRLNLKRRARIGGEGVDLVALVDRLVFTPPTPKTLRPILDQYAAVIDAPLRERDQLLKESRDPLPEAEGTGGMVFTIGGSPLDSEDEAKILKQRVALRDLNDQYARLIASRLSPTDANAFTPAFELAAFPRIYRATRADAYYEKIIALDNLPEPQRLNADSIYASYGREVESLNDSIADYQRRRESRLPEPEEPLVNEDGIQTGEVIMSVMVSVDQSESGESPEGAFTFDNSAFARLSEKEQRLVDQKKELIQSTIDRLFALLSTEQQARLPIPPARKDGRFHFERVTLDDGTQMSTFELGEGSIQILTNPGQDASVEISTNIPIDESPQDDPENEDH